MKLSGTLLVACLAAALAAPTSPARAEEGSLAERCEREVVELHRFLEAWSNAELPDTDAAYERFSGVIAPDFVIIGPDGEVSGGAGVVAQLRGAHGRWRPAGRIVIEGVRSRIASGELCLVQYVEKHLTPEGESGWTSSALLRVKADTPNGVEWFHLSEVGLPSELEER